ncbi:uncharacterized protein LOC119449350 isoform X1 [Dermacentor silvarum]|uniref:uncharacterized protein LOC119449350 isoform X1 n=2 Tax=Dermacentor silvarum TaxID=543639 RepID=UPI002100DD6B|nr:uncharacterized protein LOC119449350 isoform X1 [Dermacentor silvarum]
MKRKDPTESPKKALSAWERRRLYSNQLREKTVLRTPGAGPSYTKGSGTPSRMSPNKNRPRESKHPVSQRKPLKSVHSLTAKNGKQFTVSLTKTSGKKPKASLQSGKAQMTVKPVSKTASGTRGTPLQSTSKKVKISFASEPTTAAAAVSEMPQLDKKSTRMSAKQQPQKAKQPLRVPLAQAKVQLSQRPVRKTSTAPTQTKMHTARRSLGRRSQVVKASSHKLSLTQIKAQTSRRSSGRKSTAKLSAKTRAQPQPLLASGARCSVGEQPRKRASEGNGETPNKTPLKTAKVDFSPCLSANSACVEPRSSPRSCQSKSERRTSLASYSTPCSVMVKKSALNSCGTVSGDTKRTLSPDRSSGSTPYHTAHSICLSSSSGDSVSPIGKVSRKFAGGTPSHIKQHSSFVSATGSPTGKASPDRMSLEDVSTRDELNDTFTLESPALSPKRRSSCSKKPPSSCLRKGTSTSHVKKSVSFTMPGRRSVTPKRLPKTPIRSRTLQETLKEWLNARGYSLSALRKTHEDKLLHQEKLQKSRRSSGKPIRTALMSAENKALGTSPVLQKSVRNSLQKMSGNDEAASSKHTSLPSLLTDLLRYLNEPNPPEDVETWLNQLEEHVPSVMDYPAYWMCRCACYEKSGDSAKAVKSLRVGLDFVTMGHKELADALDGLVKKAPEVTHNSPTRKRERKQNTGTRKKQNLEHVSTENVFASTIIDYKVYEKPSLNQLSAALRGKQCPSVAVMTPVRRSSRHTKRHSSLVSPPQTLLYKPNSALGDEP